MVMLDMILALLMVINQVGTITLGVSQLAGQVLLTDLVTEVVILVAMVAAIGVLVLA